MPTMRTIDKNRLACIIASLPSGAVVTTISSSLRRRKLYIGFIANNRHEYTELVLEPQTQARRESCSNHWEIELEA